MKTPFLFYCVVFVLLTLVSCNEPVTLTREINVVETEQEQISRQLTPKEIFSKLRGLFQTPMLSGDLQKLQDLTENESYLDFLSQEYPAEGPFQTFDAFLETAPPDSQRYLPFLKKFIEHPTVEDITILHQITHGYRNANATQHHILNDPNAVALLHTVLEKKTAVMEDKKVQKWFERHFQVQEIPVLEFLKTVILPIENFVIETEKEDARRIQDLFNEHGRDDGTIWLAIEEPVLTGEIINNFTDAEVFLAWVKGDFFPDRPLEVNQQVIDLLQ